MQYLSYLEGIARIRELCGAAHHSQMLSDLKRMLEEEQLAILDIGSAASVSGQACRAIFCHGLSIVEPISFRDCQAANVRVDARRLQGGPFTLPRSGVLPPIVLGGAECRSESNEIALNFARPFATRLEVRSATPGSGNFILLFGIEYRGRLLRCRSRAVRAELSGRPQFLEFELPEISSDDEGTCEFLEAASFVELCSLFFALGAEIGEEQFALQSNWAFGFTPAHYVD